MSFSIEYNSNETNKIVYTNILKMLYNRRLITDLDKSLQDIESEMSNMIIDIKLNDDTKVQVHNVNGKITTISQGTQLHEFLSSNVNIHKIVVLKEPSKKVLKQILTEYKNAEYFFEYELMEDVGDKIFIPKHILLNNEEQNELLDRYKETELSLIRDSDRMVRHIGGKFGDIVKIIRLDKSIIYRRVVHGSVDDHF